jgi:hypothetical protein
MTGHPCAVVVVALILYWPRQEFRQRAPKSHRAAWCNWGS